MQENSRSNLLIDSTEQIQDYLRIESEKSVKPLRSAPSRSKKQKKIRRIVSDACFRFLAEIQKYIDETGFYPSQREIGRRLNLTSSATSVGYVEKLEYIGLIEWHRTSGIKLTRMGVVELIKWLDNLDPSLESDISMGRHFSDRAITLLSDAIEVSRENIDTEEALKAISKIRRIWSGEPDKKNKKEPVL